MDLTPRIPEDRLVLESYHTDGFTVSGTRHATGILLFPSAVLPWTPASPGALAVDDFAGLAEAPAPVTLVLLGTGHRLVRPTPAVIRGVRDAHGVAIEVMDTGAACRTYGVLLAEGRDVAAALLPAGV